MYKFVVIPDPAYHTIDGQNIRLCENESEVNKCIKKLSNGIAEGGVYVYTLTSIQKMVKPPEFARYEVTANGEVLPI